MHRLDAQPVYTARILLYMLLLAIYSIWIVRYKNNRIHISYSNSRPRAISSYLSILPPIYSLFSCFTFNPTFLIHFHPSISLACGAISSNGMAKWKTPRDSAHQLGPVSKPQVLSNCSSGISKGGLPLLRDSEFRKFRHFHTWRATASRPMVKWMIQGDWAHRIGPVHHPRRLPDCSNGISKAGNPPPQDSEFRNSDTFLAAGPQPAVV